MALASHQWRSDMEKILDERGLSCPQPVLDTLKALTTSEGKLCVLVDTQAARENVSRAVESKGWKVERIEEKDGEYSLFLAKP